MKDDRRRGTRIEEVEYLGLNAIRHLFGRADRGLFKDFPGHAMLTGNGRAAIRIILEYYSSSKTIADRNDQLLIPQWLCQSVQHTLTRFCAPSLTVNKNLKGIMAYHQYGFPQDMGEICDFCKDRDLFLIEDCANVYESYYKGKRLGTFGDASIFSFSKLFPSILGGALVTKDPKLYDFGKEKQSKGSRAASNFSYASRFLYECLKDTSLKGFSAAFQEMAYAAFDSAYNIKEISLRVVNRELSAGAMKRRKENYRFILEYFDDRPHYFEHLEKKGVIPYVVPLFDKEENLKKMVKNLRNIRVMTGIYHFDVNKNMLNPNFKKCMWIPMHQGISKGTLELICKTIENVH